MSDPLQDENRQRLADIEAELFGPGAYASASILRPLDAPAQLAREERREALRHERETLLRQMPRTGEASGQHLVMNRTLGTTYVRESSYDEPPEKFDRSDPFEKFAAEMGWHD